MKEHKPRSQQHVHFDMIFLDGAYLTDGADPLVFRHVAEPDIRTILRIHGGTGLSNGGLATRRARFIALPQTFICDSIRTICGH